MLPVDLRNGVEESLGEKISASYPISGGDISDAFHVRSNKGNYFLKYNRFAYASSMFAKESKGLALLANCEAISLPSVKAIGPQFLLMEFIDHYPVDTLFWKGFGYALASLHKMTDNNFGLDHDNYIGSLIQRNDFTKTWSEFYWKMRIEPQLKLGFNSGLFNSSDKKLLESIVLKLDLICPEESPALCHGDLWSGNYIIGKHDKPYLVDPAVSFVHREMDIAMSKLFGGFDDEFYYTYQSHFPMEKSWEDRMDIYQLYYLMVHVNLFGSSYITSVRRILNKYA